MLVTKGRRAHIPNFYAPTAAAVQEDIGVRWVKCRRRDNFREFLHALRLHVQYICVGWLAVLISRNLSGS